jgi:RNA polymerase sigma-70 factor, ECF subfamily
VRAPHEEHGKTDRLQIAEVERLYRELGPRLHAFIRRQVPSQAVAADLLQDVFVRLIRGTVVLRSSGEMRSYLYRTAASAIAEHYRVARLRRRLAAISDSDHVEPEAAHVSANSADGPLTPQVERAFRQLTARDRTLLWLAHVEEMNHAEIAAAVGIGTASVKVMLFRARQRLEAALRALGISPEEAL